jgi:hypothetical protein
MKKTLALSLASLAGGILIFSAGNVLAFQIETLSDVSVEGDVVMGPGKIEVSLNPGGTADETIYFTNRTGRTVNFTVNVEDFKGSRNTDESTVFLGNERGPYSLRDYLHPDTWQFTLEHGQRISLPVKIEIPQNAEPGGLYGVVFATAEPPKKSETANNGNAAATVGIAARVGCLFFVRVNGDLKEEGQLKNFSMADNKSYFEQGPIDFQFTYENNGSVHLVPYGAIEISNMAGKKTGLIEVSPYFAMPDSERLNEIKWDKELLFGKYTAVLSLNRGYGNIIDSKEVSFWVIPWKLLLAGLLAISAAVWFLGWVFRHFEFKKKK